MLKNWMGIFFYIGRTSGQVWAIIRPLEKCFETSGWWWVVATNFSVSSRQGFKL